MTLLYPATHGRLEETAINQFAYALGRWDDVIWHFQSKMEHGFENHRPVTGAIIAPELIRRLAQ